MTRPALLGVVIGALLAWAAYAGYGVFQPIAAKSEAGATAYGWLASPAADGEPANRAKILEALIERELATRRGAAR